MVITILEAHVGAENWLAFQDEFKNRTAQLPPQMLQTFLLQEISNQTFGELSLFGKAVKLWKKCVIQGKHQRVCSCFERLAQSRSSLYIMCQFLRHSVFI